MNRSQKPKFESFTKATTDNCASVHCFNEIALFPEGLRKEITTVGGVGNGTIMSRFRGHTIFGDATFSPEYPFNLVSHKQMVLQNLFLDPEKIKHDIFSYPDIYGNIHDFSKENGKDGFYHALVNISKPERVYINTVDFNDSLNKRSESIVDISNEQLGTIRAPRVSIRDMERFRQAREQHGRMGHPSDVAHKELVSTNQIINNPITAKDIDGARIHLGPCPTCKIAIMTQRKPLSQRLGDTAPAGKTWHSDVIFLKHGKEITAMHFAVDEGTGMFIIGFIPKSFTSQDIQGVQKFVMDITTRAKLPTPEEFFYDGCLIAKASGNFLTSQGAKLLQYSPGEHCVSSENGTRHFRNQFRKTLQSLQYKLPSKLFKYLAINTIKQINATPNQKTSVNHTTPHQIFGGDKLN